MLYRKHYLIAVYQLHKDIFTIVYCIRWVLVSETRNSDLLQELSQQHLIQNRKYNAPLNFLIFYHHHHSCVRSWWICYGLSPSLQWSSQTPTISWSIRHLSRYSDKGHLFHVCPPVSSVLMGVGDYVKVIHDISLSRSEQPAVFLMNCISTMVSCFSSAYLMVHASLPYARTSLASVLRLVCLCICDGFY